MKTPQLQRTLLETEGQGALEIEGLHQSPILVPPFEEPAQHWDWNAEKRLEIRDFRRRAGYYFKTDRVGSGTLDLFMPENWDELTLVNRLRDDVKRWRDAGYQNPSPTNVTRRLLDYWFNRERERRFFFCQREAVETLIYLAELRLANRGGTRKLELDDAALAQLLNGEKPHFHVASSAFPTLMDAPFDREEFPLELRRAACKMATGSGKTVVMALLVAWSFCNAANSPNSEIFPSVALICAPNLTVKERLQVLRPDVPGNYYEAFDIVPPDLMPAMKRGRVIISNWHAFAPRAGNEEGGVTSRVVKKGVEGPQDLARRILGEAHGRWPILVFNDEGHHCWRPAPDDLGGDKDEKQEATVWISGLDAINNARHEYSCADNSAPKRGISLCIDLSATPFYIGGSGHAEGSPFPWIVSDFGLTDAIESGIVKIPRVPVNDTTGRAEPKYFRLWNHINSNRTAGEYQSGRKRLKPEVIFRESEDALNQLAGQWRERFQAAQNHNSNDSIPPVLIIVCDNT